MPVWRWGWAPLPRSISPTMTSRLREPTVSGPMRRKFFVPLWLAGEYGFTSDWRPRELMARLWLHPPLETDAAVDGDRGAGDVGAEALREHRHRHRRDFRRRAEALQRDFIRQRLRRGEAAAGDRAGGDGVHADAVPAERAGELLYHHGLPGFRRAVVRQVARAPGMQRCHEEHAPLHRALDHVPAARMGDEQARVEVHFQHLAPLGLGYLQRLLRLLAPRARRVDENRHGAEAAHRLPGQPGGLARAREVGVLQVGAEH